MSNLNEVTLSVLNKEEYDSNPEFYQKGIDKILKSNKSSGKEEINLEEILNNNPLNSIVILSVNNIILGYMISIAYFNYLDQECEIDRWNITSLYVHKKYRKTDYGKMLLYYAINELRLKGVIKLNYDTTKTYSYLINQLLAKHKIYAVGLTSDSVSFSQLENIDTINMEEEYEKLIAELGTKK